MRDALIANKRMPKLVLHITTMILHDEV